MTTPADGRSKTGRLYKGGCLCRAVRYQFRGPVEETYHCYCRTCCGLHAAGHVTWTVLPHRQFRLLSGRKGLSFRASSRREHRAFCRTCGSHVFAESIEPGDRQDVYVALATVSGPHDLRPRRNIFADRRAGWVTVDASLPSYGGRDGLQPLAGEVGT